MARAGRHVVLKGGKIGDIDITSFISLETFIKKVIQIVRNHLFDFFISSFRMQGVIVVVEYERIRQAVDMDLQTITGWPKSGDSHFLHRHECCTL